jgi:hypothetical protein
MREIISLEKDSLMDSTILCVIDFSEHSKDALLQSIRLAEWYHCRLTVLYPYRLTQLKPDSDNISQLKKSIDADAVQSFTRMTSEILQKSGIPYEFRPEVGFINDRVYAFSKKHKIGMVVMSKRMTIVNRDAFNELLTQIQVPLLILPQNDTSVVS